MRLIVECLFDRLVGEETTEATAAGEETSASAHTSDQEIPTEVEVSLEALAEASDEFVPALAPSMDATDGAGSVSSSPSSTTNLAALAYESKDGAVAEDPEGHSSAAPGPPTSEQTQPQSSSSLPDDSDPGDEDSDGQQPQEQREEQEEEQHAAPARRGSGIAIFKRLFSFR